MHPTDLSMHLAGDDGKVIGQAVLTLHTTRGWEGVFEIEGHSYQMELPHINTDTLPRFVLDVALEEAYQMATGSR